MGAALAAQHSRPFSQRAVRQWRRLRWLITVPDSRRLQRRDQRDCCDRTRQWIPDRRDETSLRRRHLTDQPAPLARPRRRLMRTSFLSRDGQHEAKPDHVTMLNSRNKRGRVVRRMLMPITVVMMVMFVAGVRMMVMVRTGTVSICQRVSMPQRRTRDRPARHQDDEQDTQNSPKPRHRRTRYQSHDPLRAD